MSTLNSHEFFVLRRPLLSVEKALRALSDYPTKAGLESYLQAVYSDPLRQEALYLASPTFYERFRQWQQGEPIAERDRLLTTLLKYYLRMSTRCTPYGLFAGCTVGQTGEETALAFKGIEKQCRLDMNYVGELLAHLLAQPGVLEQLLFYPNNSLYRVGNQFRYTAYQIIDKQRHYALTSVDVLPALETLLQSAKKGAFLSDLVTSLVGPEISREEAAGFVGELVEAQVLISELEPTVTGEEYFRRLLRKTEQLSGIENIQGSLRQIQAMLDRPDRQMKHYFQIKQELDNHLIATDSQDLFQTDLFFDTQQAQLSRRVTQRLSRSLDRLLVLNQPTTSPDLEQFRKKFHQLYEEQEIPLMVALDNELGVSYGKAAHQGAGYMPLIEDVTLSAEDGAGTTTPGFWSVFLLNKYTELLQKGSAELVLTDEDLKRLTLKTANPETLPASAYAFGTLLAASEQALDQGDFLFQLNAITGPSVGNLLGRFCHGDAALTEHVRQALRKEQEQYPDQILAEVVHLPESRTGNILMRPTLRPYEIPFLAASSVEEDHQIPVDDLMVSVPQGREIVLRSKRLNRRVMPRLSSAHNFRQGLHVYKFLCDLQYQHQSLQISWNWHQLSEQVYLPRVRYQNILLSRAVWNISAEEHSRSSVALFRELRGQLRMPRYVVVQEHDHEMLIDTESEPCYALLTSLLQKKKKLRLVEFLQTPDQCWVQDAQGRYTHELILPLHIKQTTPSSVRQIPIQQAASLPPERVFGVGSDWLYFKIYSGEKRIDALLTEVIHPLTERLLAENTIDRMFFVRYQDPDSHVRVRFRAAEAASQTFHQVIISELHAALAEPQRQGLIYNVVVDTYRPEIERYGATTMSDSEQVFHLDSQAVLAFLPNLIDDESEEVRWLFALAGTNSLLDAFGYDLSAKKAMMTHLQNAFFTEFGGDAALRNQLNTKYRKEADRIGVLLENPAQVLPEPIPQLLADRARQLRPLAEVIRAKAPEMLDQLVSSYLHMFLNRLLVSNHRLHELVIYHYLFRHYTMLHARRQAV